MTGITGTGSPDTATEDVGSTYDAFTELLGNWQRAFDDHRMTDLVALFTDDALFQGISPQVLVGPAEILGYYHNVAEGATAIVEVRQANRLREEIMCGFADVTFTARTGETFPIRLSIVAQDVGGTWLIRQYHAAAR